MNRFDGPNVRYVDTRPRRIGVVELQDSLDRLNSKISTAEMEKNIQREELKRTLVELERTKIDAQKAQEETERARKLEENLRSTTQRETHLTEHLNAVTQRADSVTSRNEELQDGVKHHFIVK